MRRHMPTHDLTQLANQFGSDKGDTVLCAHGYTKVYEALLEPARDKPIRLLEIGLIHGHTQSTMGDRLDEVGCPSLKMWAQYLPQAALFGFDTVDFRSLSEPRMTIFQGDQSRPEDLAGLVEQAGGPFDVIIDDGSHASHHQQIALAGLFPHLAPGGLYCIEDLHYQPVDLEVADITKTREFLRDLRFGGSGAHLAIDQTDLATLLSQLASVHFFDSRSARWTLAQREDALAILVKRGTHPLLGNPVHRLPQDNAHEASQVQRDSPYVHLPASFVGHAAIHGQRIYCGSTIASPDPKFWTSQDSYALPNGKLFGHPEHYPLGDDIHFRQGGNAKIYQLQGWDSSSSGGTWTIAPTARLWLALDNTRSNEGRMTIEIQAQGLVGPTHPTTQAEVVVNKISLGIHAFGHEQTLLLPIPEAAISLPESSMLLEFNVLNPIAPREQGLSEDQRDLGLLLVRLRVCHATE